MQTLTGCPIFLLAFLEVALLEHNNRVQFLAVKNMTLKALFYYSIHIPQCFAETKKFFFVLARSCWRTYTGDDLFPLRE